MNQNPLVVMLARKRNQTFDTSHQGQPCSERIPASKTRNSRCEAAVAPQQYQPPFTIVPTNGSYPPDLPQFILSAESPAARSLGPWPDARSFRPKYLSTPNAHSPIPTSHNITHALLQREALTKFHLAVYLADEDAGHDGQRRKRNLDQICEEYMPAMKHLGIMKHQIVFFYHGRVEIAMGNAVWNAITEWEKWEDERQGRERLRSQQEARTWNDLARHSETVSRVRHNSGIVSESIRDGGRARRRGRAAIDDEDWPETVGGQW